MKRMQFLKLLPSAACLGALPCMALAGDGAPAEYEEVKTNSAGEAPEERRFVLQTYNWPELESYLGGRNPISSCASLYGEWRCDEIARAKIASVFCERQGALDWQSFLPDCGDWPFMMKTVYQEFVINGQVRRQWTTGPSACRFRYVVCSFDVP